MVYFVGWVKDGANSESASKKCRLGDCFEKVPTRDLLGKGTEVASFYPVCGRNNRLI